MKIIQIEKYVEGNFDTYGEIKGMDGEPDIISLNGTIQVYPDRVRPEYSGHPFSISLLKIAPKVLPLAVPMLERHPLGSQTFIPMYSVEFIVIVADDENNLPVNLRAFHVEPNHVLNIHRNIWHAPIAPFGGIGALAVLDRIGRDDNLEIYNFDVPYIVAR